MNKPTVDDGVLRYTIQAILFFLLLVVCLSMCSCSTNHDKILDAANEAADEYLPPAVVKMLHGKTACQTYSGVNPYLRIISKRPFANELFLVDWYTAATQVEGDVHLGWIVFSSRPMKEPVDFTPYGATGCWLLVNPDVLIPIKEEMNGPLFFRESSSPNVIHMRFPLNRSYVGTTFWMQLLVLVPDNRLGIVASPAIQVKTGEK